MSDLQSPNIPQVGSSTDPNVRRGLDAIRDFFNKLFQQEGGLATIKDLQEVGLMDDKGNPLIDPGVIPPQITGFVATGAFRTIILSWDDMHFKAVSHYEIYRSETSDFGGAEKIGTTSALVFSDTPPIADISKSYYYWVRMVSTTPRTGPWSDDVHASTANDPTYLLQLLSNNPNAAQFAVPGEEPFYVLTEPTIINGQLVPAGMYVNAANIVDLTSGNIRAGGIAADRLSVTELSAITADLGEINAGIVNGVEINGTEINGGTVNGTAINGGTITGAILQTSEGNAGVIRLQDNTLVVKDTNGVIRVKLGYLE